LYDGFHLHKRVEETSAYFKPGRLKSPLVADTVAFPDEMKT